MNIDIGGGAIALLGYINLDPVHGEGDWKREAQYGYRERLIAWPTDDNSVDKVHASHVMEHIPAGRDRINVFNEAWRVLKPGGTFTVIVPLFPSWQAIADPTHVSFWVPESFDYFVPHAVRFAQADYGIMLWRADLGCTVEEGWLGTWIGTKP